MWCSSCKRALTESGISVRKRTLPDWFFESKDTGYLSVGRSLSEHRKGLSGRIWLSLKKLSRLQKFIPHPVALAVPIVIPHFYFKIQTQTTVNSLCVFPKHQVIKPRALEAESQTVASFGKPPGRTIAWQRRHSHTKTNGEGGKVSMLESNCQHARSWILLKSSADNWRSLKN